MSSPTSPAPISRRRMLGLLGVGAAAALLGPAFLPAALAAQRPTRGRVPHPEPRPGVTAERVLPADAVPAKYRDAYAAAREIPQVLDGIHCHCDCAAHRGMRSLLSCYESDMPQSCGICLGEARLARSMHKRGRSLAEIRAQVDKRFGGGGHDDSHDHAG